MFGSGSGQTSTPFNFQPSQSNILGSGTSNAPKPSFNFGGSAVGQGGPVLGANSPSSGMAAPSSSSPFQFVNQGSSSSAAFPSTTTASRDDLKRRSIKKAVRRINKNN